MKHNTMFKGAMVKTFAYAVYHALKTFLKLKLCVYVYWCIVVWKYNKIHVPQYTYL